MLTDWIVNLDKCTATHPDGWVFRFKIAEDDPDAIDGECIGQPEKLTSEHINNASRIANEAGGAYAEARRARH